MQKLRYFYWSFLMTVLGLVLIVYLGWSMTGSVSGTLSFILIGTALIVLEISFSFDNAIVNANTLKHMTPVWQKRFLTWGILIAVFGMRLVLPIAIVAIASQLTPIDALGLALTDPEKYSQIIEESYLSISAFGGTFLMMVGLSFFFDKDKDVTWLQILETYPNKWSSQHGIEVLLVLIVIMVFTSVLPQSKSDVFLFASILGLVTYQLVELLGRLLEAGDDVKHTAARGGLGAFLYLEVLDASFSFDGVIGAFALTSNLFLIAIGLGVGAMYVRSMTIMLVEKNTLTQYRFLEHGAFYSILAISMVMFMQSLIHIPEAIVGMIGIGLIGLALRSSIKFNRSNA